MAVAAFISLLSIPILVLSLQFFNCPNSLAHQIFVKGPLCTRFWRDENGSSSYSHSPEKRTFTWTSKWNSTEQTRSQTYLWSHRSRHKGDRVPQGAPSCLLVVWVGRRWGWGEADQGQCLVPSPPALSKPGNYISQKPCGQLYQVRICWEEFWEDLDGGRRADPWSLALITDATGVQTPAQAPTPWSPESASLRLTF